MLSPADIADRLTSRANRTKPGIAQLAKTLAGQALDLETYVDEIRIRPLPVRWYMTWLLSHYVEKNRDLCPGDQCRIWKLLKDCGNRRMERDLWRALSFIEVDDDIAGEVFDTALDIIPSPQQPIGLRAHAIYAARNIARPYPELRRELLLVLEELPADEPPAIRTRSRQVLGEFRKTRTAGNPG